MSHTFVVGGQPADTTVPDVEDIDLGRPQLGEAPLDESKPGSIIAIVVRVLIDDGDSSLLCHEKGALPLVWGPQRNRRDLP